MSSSLRLDEAREVGDETRASAASSAWVVLFADGLVLWSTSLYWIAWGHFFDEGFYEATTGGSWEVLRQEVPYVERVTDAAVRQAGLWGAMASMFVIAVSVTSFRRHERWAWYAAWAVPALAVLDFAVNAGHHAVTPLSVAWDITVGGLALVALALPYRMFFPESSSAWMSR